MRVQPKRSHLWDLSRDHGALKPKSSKTYELKKGEKKEKEKREKEREESTRICIGKLYFLPLLSMFNFLNALASLLLEQLRFHGHRTHDPLYKLYMILLVSALG